MIGGWPWSAAVQLAARATDHLSARMKVSVSRPHRNAGSGAVV